MANKKTKTNLPTYIDKLNQFYQKKEVKSYSNLILSIALITFFASAAIRPTITTITSLNKEIKDQKEVLKGLDQKIKDLSRAQQEYRRWETKIDLIENALPPTPELTLFVGQIEVLAQKNNLKIKSLQTEKTSLKGDSDQTAPQPAIGVSVSLSGSYQQIENFLTSLMNSRRITNVEDFSIRKEGSGEFQGALNLALKLKAYYLPTF